MSAYSSMKFQQAAAKWSAEIDDIACELLERGVPPYDALDRARGMVADRRRAAANNVGIEALRNPTKEPS